MEAGTGNDKMFGGTGSDLYFLGEASWGKDKITDTPQALNPDVEGQGNQLVPFNDGARGRITVNLGPNASPNAKKGTNTVDWPDTVIAGVTMSNGDGGDTFTGNAESNLFDLNDSAGGNTVSAGGARDRIEANNGTRDVIDCGTGRDIVFFDKGGVDQITGCEDRQPR